MKNVIKKGSSQIEKMKSMAGFTLIELLVVMAIVGGVAGALLPAVRY